MFLQGYNVHLVATAFEWVMALDLLAFLMTFSQELHIIQLQVVLVSFILVFHFHIVFHFHFVSVLGR